MKNSCEKPSGKTPGLGYDEDLRIGALREWQIVITTTLSSEPLHEVVTKVLVTACWSETAREKALLKFKAMHGADRKMMGAPKRMKVIPLKEVRT